MESPGLVFVKFLGRGKSRNMSCPENSWNFLGSDEDAYFFLK